MKSKLFFIFLIALTVGACSKDKTKDKFIVEVPATLIGQWEWISSTGGLALVTYTPASTGVTKRIEFDIKGNYRYYENDNLKSKDTYYVERRKSLLNHDTVFILNTNRWLMPQSFSFPSFDILDLHDEAYDGFGHHYTRIK